MAASPKNIGPKTYGLSCGNQPLCRIMFHILKYSPGNPPTIMGLVPPSPAANRRHADRDCQCDPEGPAAHPARDRPRQPQAGRGEGTDAGATARPPRGRARKSDVTGKGESVREDIGGRRI